MDYIAVFLEHVDLFDCLNRLNIELLEGRLKLFVVCPCCSMNFLDLSPWCAFASVYQYKILALLCCSIRKEAP